MRCPELERVYVFGLYHRRPYLLGTWLARHSDAEVSFVYQNIPLARNCRFLHLPVRVVLTSRVNLAEAAYFHAQGIFASDDLVYAGQEYAIDTAHLNPTAPSFDIGFYSSGEWARREGLYQPDDIEAVRRGAYVGNPYDRAGRELLDALVSYAQEHQRTLRIYLHPLERRLLNEHGIEPPFAPVVDGGLITMETAEGDSRRSMYACRVAVSLQSSFIWERLDLGLDDSFIFEFAEQEMNVFERAALGPYVRNVVTSAEELVSKVDESLQEDPEPDS